MKRVLLIALLLFTAIILPLKGNEIKVPSFALKGKQLNIKGLLPGDIVKIDGKETLVPIRTGILKVEIVRKGRVHLKKILSLPGFFTLLPPLIAILLALITKDVFSSLFLGIFTASLMLNFLNPLKAFLRAIDTYIVNVLTSPDKISIVIFTLMLGAMVGVMSKSGGIEGIVKSLSKRVHSSKTTQFYTWLLGIFIFFDDYTNTLIVGNTMRPLADRWRVSREKLAYIVDSTSAPVASVALISTWVGFEISLIGEGFRHVGIKMDPYFVFLRTIPLRFYVIFALFFGFLIIITGREFGPMLKAEKRAQMGKVLRDGATPLSNFQVRDLLPEEGIPKRWINGIFPVIVVIFLTFVGLYLSGLSTLGKVPEGPLIRRLGLIFSSGDSFKALLWASFSGFLVALFLSVSQKLLRVAEAVRAGIEGMKAMLTAVLILTLAWALSQTIMEMGTGEYLVSVLSGKFDPRLLPASVFLISGIISFSTGTSWGTMSIVYPLVIPLAHSLAKGQPYYEHVLIGTIAAVLSGAVFGDHCSPISDTTIMSSMASSCDHIDHVTTQIPYALTVAFVSIFFGILPLNFGIPYIISFILVAGVLTAILFLLGKRVYYSL